MAIESFGYDGSVGEIEWARYVAPFLGVDYGVMGANDWKVSSVAGADRTLSIAAGTGHGHGVTDVSDSSVTVQGAIVSSGSRWDLVVARRDWQPAGGVTTFDIITGSSARQIPASRLADPGIEDDQPIALVRFVAGQQVAAEIVDLRCWAGNGGIVAASSDALAYLDRIGSVVRVGDQAWVRTISTQGSPEWASALRSTAEAIYRPPVTSGSFTSSQLLSTADGIGVADYARIVEVHGRVNVNGVVAGGSWDGVLTSSGSYPYSNVIDRARVPFSQDAGVGGSVTLDERFVLAAGQSCRPRLWVERLSPGQITVTASSKLRVTVRRAEG